MLMCWPCHSAFHCDLRLARAGALNQRLKHHLQRHGLYAKESFHGVRRGRMQHKCHEEGATLEAVGALALINSPEIVQRYVDRGRHQARITQHERKRMKALA